MTEETATASDQVNSGRLIYGCMGLGGSWSDGPVRPSPTSKPRRRRSRPRWTSASRCSTMRTSTGTESPRQSLARSWPSLPGLRDRIQLQTKCGIRLNERGLETHYDLSADAIIERVNGSLERLRTDYVDVLLLHRPDPADGPRGGGGRRREADGGRQGAGAGRVQHVRARRSSSCRTAWRRPVVANQLETEPAQAGLAGEHRAGQPSGAPRTTASRTAPWNTAPGRGSPCRPTARWRAGTTPAIRLNGPRLPKSATARCWRTWHGKGTPRRRPCCWDG